MSKIMYLRSCIKKGDMSIVVPAIQILLEYKGYRLTLRQLFYQFVSRGYLSNTNKMYNKLCRAISRGRMGGLIDWAIIEDRTRFLRSLPHWNSPASIIAACADQYHVDYWQNQRTRVEFWIEKDALIGVIEEICDYWDVPIFSCRGYTSATVLHEAALRAKKSMLRGQRFKILYAGDHDPSGLNMDTTIVRKLKEFGVDCEFERVALSMEQIKRFNLPPNPVKKSDKRAEAYCKKYGNECWELDALSPQALNEIIETAIVKSIDDMDDFNDRREEDTNSGGGISNSGTLTVTECIISGNAASGGVAYGGGISNAGALTVTNSTISVNSASEYFGGGIYNSGVGTLINCVISGNSAYYDGGGIYNIGTLTATNCTVTKNTTNGRGGGIYNSGVYSLGNTATLSVVSSTITDNRGPSGGGGIYNHDGAVTTVINSTISGNTVSAAGGGICNTGFATLTVTNSTITGNSAGGGGGGISGGKTLTVTNSTIAGNTGGGISGGSILSLYNTIVVQNSGFDITRGSSATRGYNNLTTFTDWSVYSHANNVIYNPNLPLFINSTSGNYRLAPSSQAIDKGNNNYVSTTTDLVGNPRIRGGIVDIGAYEYGVGAILPPESPSVVVTTLDDAVFPYDGKISLREAIAYAGTSGLGTTITFASSLFGQTIILEGYELYLDKNITIDATGMNIIIDADKKSRVFHIAPNTEVFLVGLTITNGNDTNGIQGGGGISNWGMLNLANCTISGNFASYGTGGGGIYNFGTLTVTNSTVSGNSATWYGGGIYSSGTLTVTNSTIAGNLARDGGGIYTTHTVQLYNTIVAKNSSDIRQGAIVGYNNIVGKDPRFMKIPATINTNNTGWRYNSNDWDLRLASDSPAIDKGNNDYVIGLTDLAGNYRIANGTVDIGAYEYGSAKPVPQTPVNFHDAGKAINSVTLAWNATNFATGYEIQYREFGNTAWSTPIFVSGTTINVTGLNPETIYEFQVRASNAGGHSAWSASVSVMTNPLIPTTPTNFYYAGKDKTSVMLEWNAVTNATGYEIQYRKFGDTKWSTPIFVSGTTINVTGLDFGTMYEFQIRATNASGHSAWSTSVSVIPDPLAPPATPTSFHSIGKTSDSVILVWDTVPDATGYAFRYRKLGEMWSTPIPVSGMTATKTGLTDDTEYEFQVRASNADGNSVWSDSVFVTTDRESESLSLIEKLRKQYPGLNLSANIEDYNIIEITAAELSDERLRSAIAEAGMTTENDLIVVRTTATQNTITLSGLELVINTDAAQLGSVTIVSLGEKNLTINADQKSRVLSVTSGTTVALAGLTLTGGNLSDNGGGIYNLGTLTVTNSIIAGNSTLRSGGGIYSPGTLMMTASTITGNLASYDGGGICGLGTLTVANSTISSNSASSGGGIRSSGTLTLTNSTISGNSSPSGGGLGGGLFNSSGTATLMNCTITGNSAFSSGGGVKNSDTLTVTNSEISGNSAPSGGGICSDSIIYGELTTLMITSSTITGNLASRGGGGGIRCGSGVMTLIGSTISGNSAYNGGGISNNRGTLTVTNSTITENSAFSIGGGISCGSGAMTLTGSTISGNSASSSGGGIYSSNNTLTVTNSSITGNTASNDGGGINYSDYSDTGALTLINSTISSNSARSGGGIRSSGTLTMTNCMISENSATENGGGIYGSSTIINSIISGNSADYGGGIYGRGTIINSIISGNSTTVPGGSGGGIYSLDNTLTVTNSSITGNSALGNGGGIYGSSTIINSIISGNSAGGDGGGIYGCGTITNSTISGNSASYGGGLYTNDRNSTVQLYNTIVAKNSSEIYRGAGTIAGYNNFIGNGSNQTLVNGTNGNIVGTAANPIDPRFVKIPATINANNTGLNYNPEHWDLQLAADSPAIDNGRNTSIPLGVTTDILGNHRIANGTVDIGAYEYWSTLAPPMTPINLREITKTSRAITLAWDAVGHVTGYGIQYRKSGSEEWEMLIIVSGTISNITDLDPETEYEFQVRASNIAGHSEWSQVLVVMTNSLTPPETPISFRSTNQTNNSATLAWNATNHATSYAVQYRKPGEEWSTPILVSGTSTTITSLADDTTYEFQVRATNADGNSGWSESVFVTTIIAAPVAPANFKSTDQTTSSVSLTWDVVTGATGYILQYKKASETNWMTAPTPTGTSAVIDGLDTGTKYEFQVRASNAGGTSAWVKTNAATLVTPPVAPANFRSVAQTSDSVTLSWAAQSNLSGYVLEYKKLTDLTWTTWVSAPGTSATSATITGLTANTAYDFRLTATNTSGNASSITSTTTEAIPLNPPVTPTNFRSTGKTTDTITIQWDTIDNASGYEIQYRQSGTTPWTNIFVSETTGNVTALFDGTEYEFQVRAVNTDGHSTWSASVLVTTIIAAPSIPLNFKSTGQTTNSVTLQWDTADRASGYALQYKKTTDSDWATVSATGTETTITGLAAGTVYDFRLQATNAGGHSDWATITATTNRIKLAAPQISEVSADSSSISLQWSPIPNANKFLVQYSVKSDFTGVTTIEVTKTLTKIDGLDPNKTYYVRVMATGTGSYQDSDYGNAVSITTAMLQLGTPTLGVRQITSNSVSLSWENVTGATNYVIERLINEVWTPMVTTSDTSYVVSNLTPATPYQFRIKATATGFIDSDYSNEVTAKTATIQLTAPILKVVVTTGSTEISVAWDTVANAAGYIVEYALTESFTDKLNIVTTGTSIMLSDLDANTTYYVRVIATGTGSYTNSDYSETKSATTSVAAPALPGGFKSTDLTVNSVLLTWDAVTGATGYVLQYKKATETEWITIPAPTGTSATITGLIADTTYDFRIRAINAGGESDWATFSAKTIVSPPIAPNNFRSTAQTTDSVTLQWDSQSHLSSYTLEYKLASSQIWTTWTLALGTDATSATITGLSANTAYDFRLTAANASGTASATTNTSTEAIPLNPPVIPNSLQSSDKTIDSVTLQWDAVKDASNYGIQYRKAGESAWTIIPVTETAWTITGLADATDYEFQVRASNNDGHSPWSTSVFVTTMVAPPFAPANFKITAQTTDSITLSWTAQDNLTGYTLEYKISTDTTWTTWTLAPGVAATSVTITGLMANTAYDFRLTATNASGSAASMVNATTEAIPLNPPVTPANFGSTAQEIDSVTLAWSAIDNATNYEIQYRKAGDLAWTPIFVSETTSTITGLADDTGYEFQIRAINADGYSDWSASVFITTIIATPATPPNFKVSGQTADSVTLQWDVAARTSDYILEYKKSIDTDWMAISVSENGITIDSLVAGTMYDFRIQAVNAGGESAWTMTNATTDRIMLTVPQITEISVDSDSISAEWLPVPNASTYIVQYSTKSDFTGVTTIEVSETFTKIGDLDANVTYYIRVMATGTGSYSDSEYGDAVSITTATIQLTAPILGEVIATSSTTINVTWNNIINATSYVIEYALNDSFTNTQTISTTDTSATLTSLEADTLYYVRIMAKGTGKYTDSHYSVTKSETTIVAPPALPANFKSIGQTADSVTLQWDTSTQVTSYILQYKKSTQSDWTIVPVTGTEATLTGLSENTVYNFRVQAVNAGGVSGWTTTIATTLVAPPVAPENFGSVAQTTDSVTLSWTVQDNLTSYVLEYKISADSTWTTWISAPGTSATNATITGLSANTTYVFRLTATNPSGSASSTTSASTEAIPLNPPATPTNLHGIGITTDTITLQWDALNNATNYEIQYRRTGVTSWTNMTVSETTWDVIGLVDETEYEFQVRATNSDGHSTWSTSIFVTTIISVPAIPSNFKSTGQTTDSVTLQWDSAIRVASYALEYKKSVDTDWTAVFTTETEIAINGLAAGTEYEFRLQASNAGGTSNWVKINAITNTTKLAAPQISDISADSNSISLQWSTVSNVNTYLIQYSLKSDFTDGITIEVSETFAKIDGLDANVMYFIRALAVGTGSYQDSDYGDAVSITTAMLQLATPTLDVRQVTSNSVSLSWENVTSASNYVIERLINEVWTPIVSLSDTSYVVNNLTPATSYQFRIKTIAAGFIDSDYSATKSVTTESVPLNPPTIPVNLRNTGKTIDTITLQWNAVDNATDYEIQYRRVGESAWTPVSVSVTIRNITGLAADVEYEFQARALNADGYSAWTASIFATTDKVIIAAPSTPANFISPGQTVNSVTLQWDASPAAINYVLQYKKATDTIWVTIPEPNGMTVTITGLDAGTEYNFQVQAVNTGGKSNWATLTVSTEAVSLPIAEIHADSTAIQDGASMFLSGRQETRSTNLTYLWDLNGDGEYETEGVSVRFSTDLLDTKPNGRHTIWHKVVDEFGVESKPVSFDISIVAVAPTYEISGPNELFEKTPTYWEFSATTVSYRPIMDWEIDWGDGSEPTQILGGPRSRINVTHYFREAGTYTVTLKTTDFDGLVTTVKIGSYTVQARMFEPVQEQLTVASFALMEPELVLEFDTPVFSLQEEPVVSFAASMPFTEISRFSDNYLSDLMETMRQRQMLDLDQSGNSGQKSESVAFSELVWSDDDLFDTDWIGPSEKAGKSDFWSEVLEDDLVLLK